MYADGRKVTLKDAAITESQALELLANTLGNYEKAVNDYVKVPLTQNEFDALVSFTYNLGAGNLLSSTLLKKLNAGDKAGAANQFDVWTKAGGKVLQGLVTRRAAEKALFLKP
jgi:lysozyme